MGYVYLIQNGDLFKIGRTDNLQRRLKQLQLGQHLKKRCKLSAPTWQKEVGWAPEVGLFVVNTS